MKGREFFKYFFVRAVTVLLILIYIHCVTSASHTTYLSDEVRASIKARIANAECVGMVVGVVVLANMNIGHDDIGFHVLDNTIALRKIKDIFSLEPKTLDKCAGEFKVMESGDTHLVKRRGGQLILKSSGQRPVFLFPKSEKEFQIKFSTMRVSFEADASGKIVKMIMHEPGKKTEAIKIK